MYALQTIVAAKTIKGTSFVGVQNYENSKGEVSNQTFIVGINYANLLANDLKKLKSVETKRKVVTLYATQNKTIVKKGYSELVASLEKRTASEQEKQKLREQGDETIKRSDAQSEAFVNVSKGLKTKDSALYIYGLCVRKTVLKKGEYKPTKKQAKTIVKNKITKLAELNGSKYRTFKLGATESLNIQGVTLNK